MSLFTYRSKNFPSVTGGSICRIAGEVSGAVFVFALLALLPLKAAAQSQAVTLREMHNAALKRDPRGTQRDVQSIQSQLRLRNIRSEWYPSFSLEGKAQYQSTSATFPGVGPGGAPVTISQDKDSYDSYLGVQQKILDFGSKSRSNVERLKLVEANASVETNLYKLKEEVNSAYFNATVIQNRISEVQLAIDDLSERLKEADSRVSQGASTAGEPATIKVGILKLRQDLLSLESHRKASVAILNELTGLSLPATTQFELPAAKLSLDGIRDSVLALRLRPEFMQYSSARSRLDEESRLVSSQDKPKLLGFGRVGYGRPGLNFLNDKFDSYWLVGVQFQWAPFNWGSTNRDRQIVQLQRKIIDSEESAFAMALSRASEVEFASIDELTENLKIDNEIVQLREVVEGEARSQFENGVLTAAEYLSRRTELLQAKIAKAVRSVELAHSELRLMNLLGLEIK